MTRIETLNTEQTHSLFSQAIEQAEAQEVTAWLNYIRAREARKAMQAECARLLYPEPCPAEPCKDSCEEPCPPKRRRRRAKVAAETATPVESVEPQS